MSYSLAVLLNHFFMKKIIPFLHNGWVFLSVFLIGLLLIGCTSTTSNSYYRSNETSSVSTSTKYVDVEYRDDDVNVGSSNFEYLNTSGSSLVDGAWYDGSNDYMVIRLNGTYYHYCGLSDFVWDDFSSASSFGNYYSSYIKGNYDCRYNYVPSY